MRHGPHCATSSACRTARHAKAGAALVRDFVVKLYNRRNGQGVEWETIAGTLFRASFDVLRELPPPRKQMFADRVHQRSYEAMTDDPAASHSFTLEAESTPSNTGGLKPPRPKGPR